LFIYYYVALQKRQDGDQTVKIKSQRCLESKTAVLKQAGIIKH